MNTNTPNVRSQRLLIVDDNESIHEDFRRVLMPATAGRAVATDLSGVEQDLFGSSVLPTASESQEAFDFEIDYAFNGRQALELVNQATLEGRPYRVMFCDIRMPPGWDGIETVGRCWAIDPALEVVLCSAYSDYSFHDISGKLRRSDQYLILRKPFDGIEIRQLAMSLTSKSLMKEELRSQVKSLELVAEERSKATAAAELASQAKGEFLANVSHEIRTPLNGVIGMLELLESTPMDSQQERYLKGARNSADCLLSLVNGVLDLSRVEHGQMELEQVQFDVRTLVENVAEMMSPAARRKSLEIACQFSAELPECVSGDHNRLRQVLLNLVSNAVKFTDQGRVTISVETAQSADDSVTLRFAVNDTGIGIPKDRHDRLFRLFSQVDASTTRKYGGTGLGLALCRRLVELMGGTIGVESESGWGSTFWFTVRLEKATPEAPTQVIPSWLAATQVLVIIGEDAIRSSVISALQQWNISCAAYSSVASAMPAIVAAQSRGDRFDAAILSVREHGTNGRLLIEEFRLTAGLDEIPVIAVIGSGDSAPTEFRQRWGISEVISCPVRRSRLFDALTRTASELTGVDPGLIVPSDARSERLSTTGHGFRILVAEDYEINQVVVREFLTRFGFECQLVADGQMAVEKATTRQFDLVLMDCQMPEMDGFQATEEIRKVELTSHGLARNGHRIPIIALTANAISGDRELCLASGMDDYLSKPINSNALLEVLKKWLPSRPTQSAPHLKNSTEPSSAPSEGPVDLSSFDRSQLISQCFGDVDLAIELLKMFEVRGASSLREVRKAVADENRRALNHISHGIKGIAGNLCARTLQESATKLETLCRNETVPISSFSGDIEEFCANIQACLRSVSPLRQTLVSQKS